MRPGVMGSVVGGRDDRERFSRARRCGFAGVEVELKRTELRADGGRVASLRVAARETGLQIPSLVLGEHNDGGLGDEDPQVAAAAAEDVTAAIGWAAELGADIILVPFFLAGELVGAAHVERAARALRSLCPHAEDRGVTLCYEGTLPADGVQELAARVGSPAFGCYFDLANPVSRGLDTATEARALGPLIRRVHLKDTRVRGGDVHPGLGRVDFPESARALREIGYDGWLVFETPPAPEEVVRRDLSFARTVLPLDSGGRWPRFGACSDEFEGGGWSRMAEAFGAMGLDAVQVGGALLEEVVAEPDRADDARAELDGAGVSVAALAGYRNLAAPDPAARRANVETLKRCLQVAPRLGTAVVATGTGTRHPADDWADAPENWGTEALEEVHRALEELLEVAERHGSILAVEAHAKHVVKTPGHLLGLLERFPTEHLQVVCDPANHVTPHTLPAQERIVRDVLDRFEHRFVVAHLSDTEQPSYVEFLRTRRPDLPLIVEHLPLAGVPDAVRRIRDGLHGEGGTA